MRHDEHPDLGPEAWYARQRSVLEHAYLASDDPHEQSGFAGDPARWRRARRPIVEAIHRDVSLLDVGCANGLLMESLAEWAAEEGWRIEPYGLDISEALVRSPAVDTLGGPIASKSATPWTGDRSGASTSCAPSLSTPHPGYAPRWSNAWLAPSSCPAGVS